MRCAAQPLLSHGAVTTRAHTMRACNSLLATHGQAQFKLTDTSFLDKHTALLMGGLCKDDSTGEWLYTIISLPSHGRTAQTSVQALKDYLVAKPPLQLPPLRLAPGAGQGMLSRTLGRAASGLSGMVRSASGRFAQTKSASGRNLTGGRMQQEVLMGAPVVVGSQVASQLHVASPSTPQAVSGRV